jgi:hypothetical protein
MEDQRLRCGATANALDRAATDALNGTTADALDRAATDALNGTTADALTAPRC